MSSEESTNAILEYLEDSGSEFYPDSDERDSDILSDEDNSKGTFDFFSFQVPSFFLQ